MLADCCCRKANVQRHFLLHTNEKPYACAVRGCRYATNDAGALKRHEKRHKGIKNHKCVPHTHAHAPTCVAQFFPVSQRQQ